MADIKIPGIGPVKPVYVVAGVSVVGGIVIFAVYQRHKTAAAAAASASSTGQTVTDPAGNVCSTLNPQTGYCPGSPQDQQALAGLTGASSLYGEENGIGGVGEDLDSTVGPYGEVNNGFLWDPSTGAYDIPLTGTTGTASATGTAATNAQWAQQCVSDASTYGWNSGTLQADISLYLLAKPQKTNADVSLMQQVISFEGVPPVAGYKLVPPVSGNGNGPPVVTVPPIMTTVSVPDVDGMRAALSAEPALKAAGLTYHTNPTINPAHEYIVVSQTPAAGTKVAKGSRVDLGLKQIK